MVANIKIQYDDKANLLKLLEGTGVPWEMHGNILTVDKNNDLKIIAALTLCGYNYSVSYSN